MTIAVDLDNTLCSPISKVDAVEEIKRCRPRLGAIKLANALHQKGNCIYIYTYRELVCKKQTEKWLKKYGVKYEEIVFGQLKVDLYFNSKAIPPYNYLNASMVEEYAEQVEKYDFDIGSFRSRKK